MSIDRAKALKAAQKYLAKGQIDRAITEYEKMVASEPSDARSLLKLGDLYTRKGDTRGATATYRKVAQQYSQQGFFLKAVAVLKQILKLDPHDLQAVESLAEMYEKLSLTSDATGTYEQVVDAYARLGKPEKALGALGKLASLDQENVAAWIRYAEGLSKANRIDEAADAFRRGADLLRALGRTDDFVKVTERLLFHSTEDLDRARELAEIYIERGMGKAALSHLQTCFKADPREAATLGLLARAFEQIGQATKAVSVYKELARVHAEAGRKAEEEHALRAVLSIDAGDADAQRRVDTLAQTNHEDSNTIELIEADEELDDVLVVEEDPSVAAHRSAPPLENWEREAQIARLMAECEVFLRYGLREKVIAQLQRVLEIDPSQIEAREKLKDAYLSGGDKQAAVTQLRMLAELVSAGDAERAHAYLNEALQHAPGDAAVQQQIELLAVAGEGGDDGGDDDVLIIDDEAMAEAPIAPMPSFGPRETSLATALEGAEDEPDLVFEDEELPEAVAEALDEADFYLAQKLEDEAREVLEEALSAYPDDPALLEKLRSLSEEAGLETPFAEEEREDQSFALAEKLAEQQQGAAVQGPVEMEQVLAQFKEGVRRQVDPGDSATHYDLGIAYMEMGLHGEAIEEFKLCLETGEKGRRAHTMIGLSYVAKGDMQPGIEHFRRALECPPQQGEQEIDLWFEIGNAYELLEKANDALVWYEKVEEQNPQFRDIAVRIERLGLIKTPQQETDEIDAMFDSMIIKE